MPEDKVKLAAQLRQRWETAAPSDQPRLAAMIAKLENISVAEVTSAQSATTPAAQASPANAPEHLWPTMEDRRALEYRIKAAQAAGTSEEQQPGFVHPSQRAKG